MRPHSRRRPRGSVMSAVVAWGAAGSPDSRRKLIGNFSETAGPVSTSPPRRYEEAAGMSDALHFGSFRMDLAAERLWRRDEPVHLRPKTWAVLRYLVERPGRL